MAGWLTGLLLLTGLALVVWSPVALLLRSGSPGVGARSVSHPANPSHPARRPLLHCCTAAPLHHCSYLAADRLNYCPRYLYIFCRLYCCRIEHPQTFCATCLRTTWICLVLTGKDLPASTATAEHRGSAGRQHTRPHSSAAFAKASISAYERTAASKQKPGSVPPKRYKKPMAHIPPRVI